MLGRASTGAGALLLLLLAIMLVYIRKILYLCTLLWYLIGFG